MKYSELSRPLPLLAVNRSDAAQMVGGMESLDMFIVMGWLPDAVSYLYSDLADCWGRFKAACPIGVGRARKRGRRRSLRESLRRAVLVRDKHICRYCNGSANSVDHVRPYSLGGEDVEDNLVAACMPCNRKKGARAWTNKR